MAGSGCWLQSLHSVPELATLVSMPNLYHLYLVTQIGDFINLPTCSELLMRAKNMVEFDFFPAHMRRGFSWGQMDSGSRRLPPSSPTRGRELGCGSGP